MRNDNIGNPILICVKGKVYRVHSCEHAIETVLNLVTKSKVIDIKDIKLIYSDVKDPNKVDLSSLDIIWKNPRNLMGGERMYNYLMYTTEAEMMDKNLREYDPIFIIGPDRKLYDKFYQHNMAEVRGPGFQELKNSLGPSVQFGFLYQKNNNLMIIGPLESASRPAFIYKREEKSTILESLISLGRQNLASKV